VRYFHHQDQMKGRYRSKSLHIEIFLNEPIYTVFSPRQGKLFDKPPSRYLMPLNLGQEYPENPGIKQLQAMASTNSSFE